ncbi:NADH dehydrogenase subunit 2 (mitochondrion) [Paulinella micropora]|uniref:NADH dehydrogenase subunit 2 n=1 Tax=Paulinella micropora TaxID=1928728 RepID=A0A5K7W3F7_9EUKA|nr:NADH dehydrogenase subunit 2 [Paulinella micropora]BBL86690.1 NADH dehydrogenase subunit 2 [Paulinella micropora]
MLTNFFFYFKSFERLVANWFPNWWEIDYFFNNNSFSVISYLVYFIIEFFLFFYIVITLIYWVSKFSYFAKGNFSDLNLKYLVRGLVLNIFDHFLTFYHELFGLAVYVYFFLYRAVGPGQTLSIFFFFDHYSIFCRLFVFFTFLFSFFFFFKFAFFEYDPTIELPFLLGFILFFCLILLTVFDFFLLYLVLEGITFLLCTIIASNYRSSLALEAAIKYLVVSSLASGFIVYGIVWIFILTNQTNFLNFKLYVKIIKYCCLYNDLSFPVLLISFGFLLKLGAFPFSLWTPDVYEGSPVFVTFFFIVCIKTVFIFVFFRLFFFVFYTFNFCWRWLFLVSALGSFVFGSLGAYTQKVLKRFFAYTSLNQLGFILVSFCSSSALFGLASAIFFLIVYVFNNIIFFLAIFSFHNHQSRSFYTLTDLRGFSFKNPLYSFFITLSLFSFIGLPPLSGFFSKFVILVVLARSDFFFVIAIALLSNGISSFYYLRIIKLIWFDKPNFCRFNLKFIKHKNFSRSCVPFFLDDDGFILGYLHILSVFTIFFIFFFNYLFKYCLYLSTICIVPVAVFYYPCTNFFLDIINYFVSFFF